MKKGSEKLNKQALKAKMKLNGDIGSTLAAHLGIAPQTFSLKLNENGACFTQEEITMIINKYELTAEEVMDIFFDQKVS